MNNANGEAIRELTEAELAVIGGGGFWGEVGAAAGAGAVAGGAAGLFLGPGAIFGALVIGGAAGGGYAVGKGIAWAIQKF
jgi:hypothetical protein